MSFGTLESSRYSGTPVTLFFIVGAASIEDGRVGPYGFCDAETPIVRTHEIDGENVEITYLPWPIKHTELTQDGTLDKSDLTVSLALGTDLDPLFLAYPPSQIVNLVIFAGHINNDLSPNDFRAKWVGRIVNGGHRDNELDLSCLPVSSALKRPGLRRNYSIGCPHVLYGPDCKANKAAATISRQVASVTRNQITLNTAIPDGDAPKYVGGLLEWNNSDNGRKEVRTISAVSNDRLVITIRGLARGLAGGTSLSLVRGCNHLETGCNQHGNILNYGGQPFIPLENPLSTKNQFY